MSSSKCSEECESVLMGNLSLPVFNPENEDDGPTSWLDLMDLIGEDLNWNSTKTMLIAAKLLKGNAEAWFAAEQSKIYTWDEFKRALMLNFPRKRNVARRLHNAIALTTEKFDTYEEYARSKINLFKKTGIKFTEENLVDLVIEDIDDDELRNYLFSSNISDRKALFTFLDRYEDSLSESLLKVTKKTKVNK